MSLSTLSKQLQRLTRIRQGRHPIVSCYLKLEPRDRARGKYLIKLKNRIKAVQERLPALGFNQAEQDAVAGDLALVYRDLERTGGLPATQGVAIFASSGQDLFEKIPLPTVHRSRLVVDRTPLVRELLNVEDEVGRLLTVVLDRTKARIFEVTAFSARELNGIHADATRGGKFHSDRHGAPGMGEHTWHNRIRHEKQRHLTTVADTLFQLDRKQPVHGLVIAANGTDGTSLEPFLHTYLRNRVMGTLRLNPKHISEDHVHAATLVARAEYERQSEAALVTELEEALGTGWAVNGVDQTLRALADGKVRTMLVDADAEAAGFRCGSGRLVLNPKDCRGDGDPVPVSDLVDEALEEALRQRVTVEVLHDPAAAERIAGIAGLLRFR
jgi:peptide chain release factor subunit 1